MRSDKLIVLPELYLKLRNYGNFGRKSSRRAWHVVPAQEVEHNELLNFSKLIVYLFHSTMYIHYITLHYNIIVYYIIYITIYKMVDLSKA